MAHPFNTRKVAIPKLDRGPLPPPKLPLAPGREDRTTRACKTCRKRKVKCSGDVPRCTNCQTNDLSCVYEQSRRDRLKEATDLNHTFLGLFRELSVRLNDEDKKRVQHVIDAAEEDMFEPDSTASSLNSLGKRTRNRSASRSPNANSPTKKNGEAHVTASVGSNEDLDYLDEDLLRDHQARQTGYVGQISEVQWLRSVQRQSQDERGEPCGLPYGPPGSSTHDIDERSKALHQRRQEGGSGPVRHVTDATFYLDSDNIDLDVVVNPYELPDPEIAEELLKCYMETIHASFPIVPTNFEDQARRYLFSLRQNRVFKVPDRWRALLNLVLAIGAKYSHLIGKEWQGHDRDHLVYMTRASHLLGLNDNIALTTGPDIPLVQATATFSLYFLVIGHVSRAWLTIGISIRTAMSLGLHLRDEVPGSDTSRKETLEKTWWSLQLIETLVSSITGRPPIISIEDTTVPLPKERSQEKQPASKRTSVQAMRTSQEGSSSVNSTIDPGDHLGCNLKLALLIQKALKGLYSPKTATKSWQNIQGLIKDLLQELEDWSISALGGTFSRDRTHNGEFDRKNILLMMNYWSTRILITRPCLCRTERRIKNQSDTSATFNGEMAALCVDSARALAAMFPSKPDLEFVYAKAPWWNVVHIIMQCVAVLLLEMGYQTQHTKTNNSEITSDIQKLITWLSAMGRIDLCADRAYLVLQRILQDAAPHLQPKAHELLSGSVRSEPGNSSYFVPPRSNYDSNVNWAQPELFHEQGHVSGHHYYPQEQEYQTQDLQNPIPFFNGHSTTDDIPLSGMRMFNTLGNPFINNWDEDMPFDGLQNLWMNTQTSFPNASEEPGSEYLNPQHQYQHQEYQPGSSSNLGDTNT